MKPEMHLLQKTKVRNWLNLFSLNQKKTETGIPMIKTTPEPVFKTPLPKFLVTMTTYSLISHQSWYLGKTDIGPFLNMAPDLENSSRKLIRPDQTRTIIYMKREGVYQHHYPIKITILEAH